MEQMLGRGITRAAMMGGTAALPLIESIMFISKIQACILRMMGPETLGAQAASTIRDAVPSF